MGSSRTGVVRKGRHLDSGAPAGIESLAGYLAAHFEWTGHLAVGRTGAEIVIYCGPRSKSMFAVGGRCSSPAPPKY